MSRTALKPRGMDWVMECDGCYKRSEIRPLQNDFPLLEFFDKGWAIGQKGDICPECVDKGETVSEPYGRERCVRDFERTIKHCRKYYGRDPQTPLMKGIQ